MAKIPGVTKRTGHVILLTNGMYLHLEIRKHMPDPEYMYGGVTKGPFYIPSDFSVDHIKKYLWAYADYSIRQLQHYKKLDSLSYDEWKTEYGSSWRDDAHNKSTYRQHKKDYVRRSAVYSLTDHMDKMRLQHVTITTEIVRTITKVINADYL